MIKIKKICQFASNLVEQKQIESNMAERELEVLENVMMSFAFADTEEKLQNCINKYLPGVLALLKTPSQRTQKKVIKKKIS